jgi:hypothetical protein
MARFAKPKPVSFIKESGQSKGQGQYPDNYSYLSKENLARPRCNAIALKAQIREQPRHGRGTIWRNRRVDRL